MIRKKSRTLANCSGTALACLLLFVAPADAQAPGGAASFTYTIAEAGQVSAAVYDPDGRLVRELIRGEEQPAGEHALSWDGLDRYGNPLKPGDYQWRVLRTPGFKAEFIAMIGTTPTSEPYQVWPGNHGAITALAADDSGMYLGSATAENTPALMKQSLDGREHLWRHRQFEAWMGPIALASDGNVVTFLQENAKLWRVESEKSDQGHYEGGIKSAKRLNSIDVLWPELERTGTRDDWRHGRRMDMAATAEFIAVSYADYDAIRWLDPQSGEIKHEAKVDAPQALALDSAGNALAISQGRVLRLAPGNPQGTVLIEVDALTHPVRLAYDRWRDELLVAEGGDSHQVKRFDAAGTLLRTYGRAGGRKWGTHAADDFRDILALTATPDGGFLVSESAVRRMAHVNREGRVVNEWLGPQGFFNFASFDPENPRRLYYADGGTTRSVVEVDEARHTAGLVASYHHPRFGDGLFPPSAHYNGPWHVHNRGGMTFLVHNGNSGPAILQVDKAAGKLIPVAVAGRVPRPTRHAPDAGTPAPLAQALAAAGYDDPAAYPPVFTWSDRNANGEFDPDEFVFGGIFPATGITLHVDDEWNVLIPARGTASTGGVAWHTLLNEAAPGSPAPRWDWNSLEAADARWPASLARLGGIEPRAISRDEAGKTYILIAANRSPGDDRHGADWPASRSGSHRLLIWTAAGEFAGEFGRHAAGPAHDVDQPTPPGHFHDAARIVGHAHGTVVVADRAVHPAKVFTKDGLYAGSFLDRRADDGFPPHVYAWWRHPETRHPDNVIPYDTLTGGSIHMAGEDEVLWTVIGENASPHYRVGGWRGWQRLEGVLNLAATPPHAEKQGGGLSGEYFANARLDGEPVVERIDGQVWFQPEKRGRIHGDWKAGLPEDFAAAPFSVRWTGRVEAQLNEAFVFSVYTHDEGRVKLWLDDRLVIDDWPEDERTQDRRPRVTWDRYRQVATDPIALEAGRRYAVRLEFASDGGKPVVSLNWDSDTQERQRLPQECLYPEP